MATYTSFQCSICRRTKDVLKDNIRATPNQCTITKGCEGRLFKIGETDIASITAVRSDLTDWYPRGSKQTVTPVQTAPETYSLSCSTNGVLSLALYQTNAEASDRSTVKVKMIQRKVEDVSYQQYLFKPTQATTLISGRDVSGKTLRFDQMMIDEGRVFVRVNGVARFQGPTIAQGGDPLEIQLTPDTVTFNSEVAVLSTIDISVYLEKDVVERELTFNANYAFAANANFGSWGNIRYVDEYDSTGAIKPKHWWIYSCSTLGEVSSSSRLEFSQVLQDDGVTVIFEDAELSNARFLLAAPPYQNVDRYLNFYIDTSILREGFYLTSVKNFVPELYADAIAFKEMYPSFQLNNSTPKEASSFVVDDTFTSSSAIPTDTSLTRISGKKIIGPI